MCTFWCLIHYLIFKKQRNRNLILNHEIRNRFQTIFQIILCSFIYQILIAFECLHLKKIDFQRPQKTVANHLWLALKFPRVFDINQLLFIISSWEESCVWNQQSNKKWPTGNSLELLQLLNREMIYFGFR